MSDENMKVDKAHARIHHHIVERVEAMQKFLEQTVAYLDAIKDKILGFDPEVYNAAQESMTKLLHVGLKGVYGVLPRVGMPYDAANNLYNTFAEMDTHIDLLADMLRHSKYTRIATAGMSMVATRDIIARQNAALELYAAYSALAAMKDPIVVGIIMEIQDPAHNTAATVSWLIEHPADINKYTIKLLEVLIGMTTNETRRHLELMVEAHKDTVIGAQRVEMIGMHGIQRALVRYGLRPGPSMPLDTLFKKLDDKYRPGMSVHDNFRRLARGGIGVLVMNSTTLSPMEFDLRGLISADYVARHDLATTQTTGLTKKVLDRFNTAQMLPRTDALRPAATRPDWFQWPAADKAAQWRVFETINGVLYRPLLRAGNEVIPRDNIRGLLMGATTRAYEYNAILARDILDQCINEQGDFILSKYETAKISRAASGPIKSAVVDKIMAMYDKIESLPNTAAALHDIILDRNHLVRIVFDVLAPHELTHRGDIEYTVTWMARLDAIGNRFLKEIERAWYEIGLPARTFVDYTGDALRQALGSFINAVATMAVTEMDRSNEWTDYDISLKEFYLRESGMGGDQ